MMVLMNNERKRIRAAKKTPSPEFSWKVDCTLSNLPPKLTQKHQGMTFAKALPWAAAILLMLAVAGPPIAKAAIPFFQRLFAGHVEKIEEDLGQPESVRMEQSIENIKTYTRSHPIEATAQVGDVTVLLDAFWFCSNPSDPHRGEARVNLAFPNAPEHFDPAALVFTLEENGQPIEAILREQRGMAGDGDGWDNVYFENGVMHCTLQFVYDAWDTEEAITFILRAQLPDGDLALPIAYDPVLAHAEALRQAQAMQPGIDLSQQEKLQTMQGLAAGAATVGASATVQEVTYTIEEISISDQTIYLSVSILGYQTPSAKAGAMDFSVRDFRVDGRPTSQLGGGQQDEALMEGILTFIEYTPMPITDQALPQTSLISLTGVCYEMGAEFPIAFQYNWETQAVTLPANEAEREAWVAQAQPIRHADEMTGDVMFPLDIKTESEFGKVSGKTYTLDAIYFFTTGEMRVVLSTDDAFAGTISHYEVTVIVDGKWASSPIAREAHPKRPMFFFDVQPVIPYTQLPEDIPVHIAITASDASHVDGEDHLANIFFDVVLHQADAMIFE